ncbi:translation initiation factor IF-2-like [Varanus komodoensis]|uniref:translation initiation factor IF-2-like n=1 Tax=Varanus komodoensis TaxID=61221 RepID=UPI001CF7D8D5|nr:translation initiation factor IF-2-like [Varanus komodoensis]
MTAQTFVEQRVPSRLGPHNTQVLFHPGVGSGPAPRKRQGQAPAQSPPPARPTEESPWPRSPLRPVAHGPLALADTAVGSGGRRDSAPAAPAAPGKRQEQQLRKEDWQEHLLRSVMGRQAHWQSVSLQTGPSKTRRTEAVGAASSEHRSPVYAAVPASQETHYPHPALFEAAVFSAIQPSSGFVTCLRGTDPTPVRLAGILASGCSAGEAFPSEKAWPAEHRPVRLQAQRRGTAARRRPRASGGAAQRGRLAPPAREGEPARPAAYLPVQLRPARAVLGSPGGARAPRRLRPGASWAPGSLALPHGPARRGSAPQARCPAHLPPRGREPPAPAAALQPRPGCQRRRTPPSSARERRGEGSVALLGHRREGQPDATHAHPAGLLLRAPPGPGGARPPPQSSPCSAVPPPPPPPRRSPDRPHLTSSREVDIRQRPRAAIGPRRGQSQATPLLLPAFVCVCVRRPHSPLGAPEEATRRPRLLLRGGA